MPRICYLTGAKTSSGNFRSHSMKAVKRTFKVNLITKKVEVAEWVYMNVKMSARAYKKFKLQMAA